MQAKYKMEDMTMSLIGLPPLLDQATLDVKRQELLKVIRASHDVIGNVQLNVAVALQERWQPNSTPGKLSLTCQMIKAKGSGR